MSGRRGSNVQGVTTNVKGPRGRAFSKMDVEGLDRVGIDAGAGSPVQAVAHVRQPEKAVTRAGARGDPSAHVRPEELGFDERPARVLPKFDPDVDRDRGRIAPVDQNVPRPRSRDHDDAWRVEKGRRAPIA